MSRLYLNVCLYVWLSLSLFLVYLPVRAHGVDILFMGPTRCKHDARMRGCVAQACLGFLADGWPSSWLRLLPLELSEAAVEAGGGPLGVHPVAKCMATVEAGSGPCGGPPGTKGTISVEAGGGPLGAQPLPPCACRCRSTPCPPGNVQPAMRPTPEPVIGDAVAAPCGEYVQDPPVKMQGKVFCHQPLFQLTSECNAHTETSARVWPEIHPNCLTRVVFKRGSSNLLRGAGA